jgi:hypothetical protein
MTESTKRASVEGLVRQLRRYQGELVRDLAYGTVRLPAGWLAPGDATIISLDPTARLDADQAGRCKVLLDQCVHLVDRVDGTIAEFIAEQRAAGARFTKNELDSLRRGRGPGRVRDVFFQQSPAWPESVSAELRHAAFAALGKSLQDRQVQKAAADRDPGELKLVIQPLLSEVRRLVLEWTTLKRLSVKDADYVVSEVLDQLIRTVLERNGVPENLTGWSHATARWKWLAFWTGRGDLELGQFDDHRGPDDLDDQVALRVDLQHRLLAVTRSLHARAHWYATLAPPRLDDALVCHAAARLVETGQVELIEAVVRGTEYGVDTMRAELAGRAHLLSPERERMVLRLVRDTLRRHLETDD